VTGETSETIGNRERSRAIARGEPGRNRSSHLPLAGSTPARWAQVSIPGPVYGRPSARQEARGWSDRPRNPECIQLEGGIVYRESRIACDETRRDATRRERRRVRNTPGEKGSRNMYGIYRTGGYALLVSEVDSSSAFVVSSAILTLVLVSSADPWNTNACRVTFAMVS